MDYRKECTCPTTELSYDLSATALPENEDLEEIDEDELVQDQPISHKLIWQEISDSFDDKRREIENYKLSKPKKCDVPLNPAVQFLDDNIFPYLTTIMEATINRAKELECIKHQKNAFNSIDFIAEMFWNLNPRYAERQHNWTYIFDMEWVVKALEKYPRPFYPFSYIWSRDYAATKIQAAMRGHWVRSRADVQEMRQFWKILAKEKEEALLGDSEKPEGNLSKIRITEPETQLNL